MNPPEQLIKWLRVNEQEVAEQVVAVQLRGLAFSEKQRAASLRDARANIIQLADCIALASPSLFNAHFIWLRDILGSYGFEDALLVDHLQALNNYLQGRLAAPHQEIVRGFILEAVQEIESDQSSLNSPLIYCQPYLPLAQDYLQALLASQKDTAVKMVLDAVTSGFISIEDLYNRVFTNVLYEIGLLWQNRKISVGQEHYGTAITQFIMSSLYERIFAHEHNGLRMMGVCIGDELHEIGIRMVCDMFELGDWDSCYLGAKVPKDSILSDVRRFRPHVVGLSVTLTPQVLGCVEIIQSIKAMDPEIKVIVGGRPFNTDRNLWYRIGAQGYSDNAVGAVEMAMRLVNIK